MFVVGVPGAANINLELGIVTGLIQPAPDLPYDAKLVHLRESSNPTDFRAKAARMDVTVVSEYPMTGRNGVKGVHFTIKLMGDDGRPRWALYADGFSRPQSGSVLGTRYTMTHISKLPMGPPEKL